MLIKSEIEEKERRNAELGRAFQRGGPNARDALMAAYRDEDEGAAERPADEDWFKMLYMGVSFFIFVSLLSRHFSSEEQNWKNLMAFQCVVGCLALCLLNAL